MNAFMGILSKTIGFRGNKFENRAASSLYVGAITYNITLAMLIVLTPLYALHLGYDLKTMGAIVSSQALLQLGLRLFGGMLSDRFGERIVMILSFSSVLVAAVMFIFVNTVTGLMGAQVFVGLSRCVYWNAAHSYGSRVSENHASGILARFLGYGSGGQIAGAVIAGAVAEAAGYAVAFGVCAGFCTAALMVSLTMPSIPRKDTSCTVKQVLKPLPQLLTSKELWIGIIVAFACSTQFALIISTYTAFFKQKLGFNAEEFGIYRSLYSLGIVVIGFAFSGIMVRLGQKALFALCMLVMGVLTLLTPSMESLVLSLGRTILTMTAIGALMVTLGAAFGISRIIYPLIATQNSIPVQRGMAMSVVGLGWSAGQLVIPVLFGYVADALGLANSFYIAGVCMILVGVLTPLLYRWLDSGLETQEGKA